jgi:hypothetical protein
MAAPLPLRADFDAAELRPSRRSLDPDQTQCLLTLVGLIGHHQRALV